MAEAQLISKEQLEEFRDVYAKMTKKLLEFEGSNQMESWLEKLMDYNVPHGKLLRAQMVIASSSWMKKGEMDSDYKTKMYMLGWLAEMVHTAGLIADDIMDRSKLRRGKKCWYLVDNVGLSAVNDVFVIENAAYYLLGLYFDDEDPRYTKILRFAHEVGFRTTCGQGLDIRNETFKDIESYTPRLYELVAMNKTSYYTFCLPVILGMILAGVAERKLVEKVKPVLLKIGVFFQIQDDFLDVYGSLETIGKDGTDIGNGKCAWPIVKALELANINQREELLKHYGAGNTDSVARVMKIFDELNIQGVFREFEQETFDALSEEIEGFPEVLPKELFVSVVSAIFRRRY